MVIDGYSVVKYLGLFANTLLGVILRIEFLLGV